MPSRRKPTASSVENEPSGAVATRSAERRNTPPLKLVQAAAKTGSASKAEEGAFGAGILEEVPAGTGGATVPPGETRKTDEPSSSRRRRGKRRSRRPTGALGELAALAALEPAISELLTN